MTPRHCLVSLLCLALLISSPGAATSRRPLPPAQEVPTASSYDPYELSYGLYWFGLSGSHQKFVPGEANPYFDPAQPTVIFVHGWQPFISHTLPDFDFEGTDTAAGWINAGWNVGIFVWNQFSDETTGVTGSWFGDGPPPQGVLDAEAKIWTASGPQGMRWRDWDDWVDGYSPAPAGTPSAGELFYQTYVEALPETYTQTIRIAGHSLGNQMAVRLTKLVDDAIGRGDIPESLRPARVALLDPYWSPDSWDYLSGDTTGDRVRAYIDDLLSSDTLFEWYWSSTWTTPPQGDDNDALKRMIFYAEMDPAYATADLDKHMAPRHLYFWSHAFPGPDPCTGEACLGMTRVLSRMSNDQLASVMSARYYWIQDGGQSTSTPGDDTYHSVLQNEAPFFTSTPVTTSVQNTPYTYTVTVDDPDLAHGDTLSITAPMLPNWLALTDHGGGHGTLAGTPTDADVGLHSVVLSASDSSGMTDEQSFSIMVWARLYLPLVFKNGP